MPFKVVQTMERGRLSLTAVPDRWEQNGILFWPKNKQEKLRRQESCTPEQTWSTINCLVKRKNLKTFQDAENEIDAMSDRSDTETDEHRYQIKKSSHAETGSITNAFNKMAQELVENYDHEASTAAMPQQVTITTDESYVPAVNIGQSQEPKSFTQEIDLGTENIDEQNILILNQDILVQQLQEDMQSIKQDVKTILNNQNALFECQSKLLLKHSEFQIQFEEYIKLSSKPQILNQDDAIKKIRNLNDLDNFEKNLSDAIIKEEYRKKLHVLCNKGAGKGTSNAYYLIDHLFDREFLKGCSWTGSSKKDSDTEKICFKAFQKTIQFFFAIVYESDKTFTKADCEKFFKIVLKNARQRCESNKRTSAARHRVKGKRNKIDTIATSSVPAVITEQPVPVNSALPAPDPSLEPNQQGVANMEVNVEVHKSPDTNAVQPSDSVAYAMQL